MATATPRFRMIEGTYGQIFPHDEGAVYEQDGHLFDAHGKYLRSHAGAKMPSEAGARPLTLIEQVAQASPAELAALRQLLGTPSAPPAADDDDEEQPPLRHGGALDPNPEPSGDEDDASGSSGGTTGDVDLVAWLKGRNWPFFSVKKAVAAQYPDVATTDMKSIVNGLIKEGVLPAGDVKRAA